MQDFGLVCGMYRPGVFRALPVVRGLVEPGKRIRGDDLACIDLTIIPGKSVGPAAGIASCGPLEASGSLGGRYRDRPKHQFEVRRFERKNGSAYSPTRLQPVGCSIL